MKCGSTRDQDRTRRSYRMTKRDATSLHTHNTSVAPAACRTEDRTIAKASASRNRLFDGKNPPAARRSAWSQIICCDSYL